jgi:SSS family solute:Na+ symporter
VRGVILPHMDTIDVGAKWTASALLLQMFAHVALVWGALLTGGVMGRLCTLFFLGGGMAIALFANHMGGVLGLIILWYGALLGPIAVPMLLEMLPVFARRGAFSAIAAWVAGMAAFAGIRWFAPSSLEGHSGSLMLSVGGPVRGSMVAYVLGEFLRPSHQPNADAFLRVMR